MKKWQYGTQSNLYPIKFWSRSPSWYEENLKDPDFSIYLLFYTLAEVCAPLRLAPSLCISYSTKSDTHGIIMNPSWWEREITLWWNTKSAPQILEKNSFSPHIIHKLEESLCSPSTLVYFFFTFLSVIFRVATEQQQARWISWKFDPNSQGWVLVYI